MEVVLLTAGAFALIMLAMAVGVIFQRKPLRGSCGGVGNSCPCAEAGRPGACADGSGPPPADDTPRSRDAGDGVVVYEPSQRVR